MNLSINILMIMVILLFYIIFFLILRIITNKFRTLNELFIKNNKRLSLIISLISNDFHADFKMLKEIRGIRQNLILERLPEKLQSKSLLKIEKQEIRGLNKKSKIRRKEAAVYLGLIGSQKSRIALEKALLKEKDYSVKVYISNALTDIKDPESLKIMIPAIVGMKRWYREKTISNILEYGYQVQSHFLRGMKSKDYEMVELWISYAKENFNEETKEYLFNFVDNFIDIKEEMKNNYINKGKTIKNSYNLNFLDGDMDGLLTQVCRTLADYYYEDYNKEKYYTSNNFTVQTNALWALSKVNKTENFEKILSFIGMKEHEKSIISILSQMIEKNPRFLYILEDAFEKENSVEVKGRMAQIISNKIEYYILKLNKQNDFRAEKIIIEILRNKKINEFIGFINLNKDLDVENRLVTILRTYFLEEDEITIELKTYLKKEIVEKWGVKPLLVNKENAKKMKDPKLIKIIWGFTFITIMLFPVLFISLNFNYIEDNIARSVLKKYVIDFNYGLAFYSVIINIIYMILMWLSFKNVKEQSRLWNLKNISMLFRRKMIPSVSIIAPAFNEEKTIVESAKSLLNLNYPEYELIIVNDGSRDETLNTLISAFKLIRVDYHYNPTLNTKPILGIYKNPSLPKLIVINKINGGKADALNAGINIANKTYFCGIDADSMLEPEALLKLASLTLDESIEIPALGGNIFPINGCSVDKGLITKIKLPKSNLARFQTIEYLRSFMVGRMGWEKLNCLLIISGAFGLFRKDRIIGIGGYLSEEGKYKKDTVGEDMELIVRINEYMHNLKYSFRIRYCFNANCWTEVPEDLKSLKNQRLRWHRGLIDILYFHRKMLFNPAYGKTGLIALPYFLFFEAIGPMLEIQGYLMVILAALLGILNIYIAIFLFITVILLGVVVSLSSLLIAEKETHYFTVGDVFRLIGYAVIENFGIRQMMSLWRIRGQMSVVFGKGGWGYIKRKGQNNEQI